MTVNGGKSIDLSGSGAEPLEAEDPRHIGAIPLLGRLGSGGMGRVYLGVVEGRYAAVKLLLPHVAEDEHFLRHFGHELDNLSRLPHEVTAPLLASDQQARPPWFATAYIPGLTLGEAITLHGGPLPASALWLLLREAAAGLRAVHALDMVHRDLKPSNVMLTQHGAILIDFGIARAADQSRLTRTGMVIGTPAYMSPEQATASRQLTAATDVFALGALLGYAAAGEPPFGEGSGVEVLYRIVHNEPDLDGLRALDPELAELAEACLAKDPRERPTADRLFQLADRKVGSARPGWPAPVMELLAERAAFAAQPTPHVVLVDERRQPEQATAATVKNAPSPAVEQRSRRRTRLLLAIVPIVLGTGTTIAVQLLPAISAPRAAVNGPSSPTSPGTSASASATTSPSAPPSASGQPPASPSTQPASPVTSAATGGTSRTGSSGSGSTGSSSRSGGSSTSGSSGATTSTPAPAPAPPSPTGAPPQPVTGMNSANIWPGATQTVTVRWNPQPDATSFDIHYTTSGGSQHPAVDTITNTASTQYDFTAYHGETSCLWIRARNQYGVSAWGTDGNHCFNV